MKVVSFKVTDDISKHLNSKANKSEYLRRLIYDDMNNTLTAEKRLEKILREYFGHCKQEHKEDISDEIDSILNM